MYSHLSFRTVHLLYPYLIFHFSFEPPSFCIFSRQITSAGIPPEGDIFRCTPLLHIQKKINWTSSICWVFVRFVSWSSSGPFGTHESLIFSFLFVFPLFYSDFPLYYPHEPLIWSFLFVFPLFYSDFPPALSIWPSNLVLSLCFSPFFSIKISLCMIPVSLLPLPLTKNGVLTDIGGGGPQYAFQPWSSAPCECLKSNLKGKAIYSFRKVSRGVYLNYVGQLGPSLRS